MLHSHVFPFLGREWWLRKLVANAAGYLAKHFGWQWGMMAPGMFGLAAGLVLLFALADKPEDTGQSQTSATPAVASL